MRLVARGGEHLDVGDEPDGARGRRLRPGKACLQPVDTVLEPAPVIEHDRNLTPGIAGIGRRRHPIDALGRVHREPFLVAELVEEPRLALHQAAELVANGEVGEHAGVVLPVGEILDELAIERVGDVV